MLPAPNPIGCKELIQNYMDAGLATVCMADADGLKGINDSYGHTTGDQFLEKVLQTLQQCFPEFIWDRYGGDEFVGVSSGEITPDANQAIRDTVQILGQSIKIGYSLGVVHTAPNDTVDLAMAMADAAMYEAKHVHHGGLLMFNPSKKVGLIGLDWGMEWYIPLTRNKVRFFLGYELGDVDFVFTQHCLTQEGIYVKTPEELKNYITLAEPELKPAEDEFGDWGLPAENLEWRSKTPESEWEQIEGVEQAVKLNIEIGDKQPPRSKPIEVHEIEKAIKVEKKKKESRFQIPQLPQLPKFPEFYTDKAVDSVEPPVKNSSIFHGKVLWVWGERSHKLDYAFALHLSKSNQVLYLDGDFADPQQPGDWSMCWAIGTPARPPSNPRKDKNLTTWGLGKRPPKLSNIKALWDNALYSLATVDRTIIVGAGKIAPPPHVDIILFVTENDVLLSYPAVAIYPSDPMNEIERKVVEVFEKVKVGGG